MSVITIKVKAIILYENNLNLTLLMPSKENAVQTYYIYPLS